MTEAYLDLLKAFNFTEMQAWIAVISLVLFTSSLLGGILSALTFVNSNQLQPRPLTQRISFRLFLLSEFMLWVFVFFYHVFMIEEIILAHIVYWVSATMMMPLLAIIGSQLMLVAFSSKVKDKEAELKRRARSVREKRSKAVEAPGGNPAERAISRRVHKPG